MDGAIGGGRKLSDTLVASLTVLTFDKWGDVTHLGAISGAVTIFLDGAAGINRSGALEVAEGFAKGFVAAAQDPIDNFAFAHRIEIVNGEIIAEHHGF